jgi:hypothetical protein
MAHVSESSPDEEIPKFGGAGASGRGGRPSVAPSVRGSRGTALERATLERGAPESSSPRKPAVLSIEK